MQIDLDALDRLVRMQQSSPAVAMAPDAVLALIAKVRELEQDAARYRWLRDQVHNDAIQAALREGDYSLDEAIDAAREEKGHG